MGTGGRTMMAQEAQNEPYKIGLYVFMHVGKIFNQIVGSIVIFTRSESRMTLVNM